MTAPAFAAPTAVDGWIEIAGIRVDDGTTDVDSPCVLSGLSVTWGRASTVDQPDTATASCTIADYTGDRTFAKLAAVGRYVTVHASATTWDPEQTVQTLPDPGFAGTPAGSTPPNVYRPIASTAAAVTAAGMLSAAPPSTSGAAARVWILPAPPSTAVDAWDDIPTTEIGQTWHVHIGAGTIAPGVLLRVGIVRVDSPTNVAAATIKGGTPWDPAAGPYDADYTVNDVGGQWLGVSLTADPSSATWDTWPDSAGATWDDVPDAITWDALAAGFTVDDVTLTAPAGGSVRDVLVFAGRITDAVAAWDEGAGACLVDVTAADLTADLANRDVGAEPWPAEPISTRLGRILTAAGISGVPVRFGPSPAPISALTVGRIDVDRQQTWPMIAALISGVDGVAWLAVHVTTGPYLWIEDTAGRPPVLVLVDDGAGHPVIVPDTGAAGVVLSACDVDLDPVRWVQTNADLATRAAITWQDQTTSPDPTDRTYEIRRDDLEAITAEYGVRRVSISSQLTSQTDAAAVAGSVLNRLSQSGGWRVGGIRRTVEPDDPAGEIADVLDLLDGTTRLGLGVTLTDLPTWSPIDATAAGTYCEGGKYSYVDGRWILELILSAAAGLGGSITWDELDPAWTWDDFPDSITWDALTGVGPGGT